jgi:basic membrane lipoprotein Med (substrate-binding protein (PBP1-ABC) superfamily)
LYLFDIKEIPIGKGERMKAAKRVLTVCMLVFVTLALCSCGQEKEAEPVKEAAQPAQKETEEAKAPEAPQKKLKAGFVYVGAVGDYGWTHAHDVGRRFAEKELPWLETVYVESISEADSSRIIDRLHPGRKM